MLFVFLFITTSMFKGVVGGRGGSEGWGAGEEGDEEVGGGDHVFSHAF